MTKQRKKLQAIATLEPSKTGAAMAGAFGIQSGTAIAKTPELILITDLGIYKRPACRSGWLLLRGHARRPISDLGEQWLRRWTTPGLDSTKCRCLQCGGVRYVDDQMVANLTNRRTRKE